MSLPGFSFRDESTPEAPAPASRWESALESRRARMAALAVVLLATFFAYSQTLLFQFVYDDAPQIVQNQHIRGWSHWTELFRMHVWAQQFGAGNYYRPLFLLVLLIEYSLFGLHTFGWHLVSVALHLGATAAVYCLAAKFTHTRWAALLAALLFGIHPIHVESVAWVSAVNDPLLAIFAISSIICYINFRRNQDRKNAWLAASSVLFACALLTKETAVIVLPILAIYEWLFAGREPRESPSSRLPYFFSRLAPLLLFVAISGAYLAARLYVLGAFRREITVLPWQTVAYTAPRVLLFYLWRLVWPLHLSLFYDVPYSTSFDWRSVLLPALGLMALLLTLAWAIRRSGSRPMQFFAWWVLLPLLPVMDFRLFPAGDVVHDRYLYLPSVGLVLLAALTAENLAARLSRKLFVAAASLSVLLVVLPAAGTIRESLPWANNLTLYLNAVERSPHLARARTALANELFERQMYPQAIAEYKLALEDDPNSFAANYNLGIAYKGAGQAEDAEKFFSRATEINPYREDAWINLGECRLYQRKLDGAEAAILRALEINPAGIGYHTALGDLRLMQGNSAAALDAYQEEVHLHPDQIEARIKAANVMGSLRSQSKSPR